MLTAAYTWQVKGGGGAARRDDALGVCRCIWQRSQTVVVGLSLPLFRK